jgi:isoleucyl-tRNA synthetase
VLSLRKKVNIRVRQPLNKILLPVVDAGFKMKVEAVKLLILSEVNVKDIEYIEDTAGILVKKIKPNFKELGKKVGAKMKAVAAIINTFGQSDITLIEKEGKYNLEVEGETIEIELADVEILSEDIPGWQVTSIGKLTVALDTNITPALKEEGVARELINRIQNIRKDREYEVTDNIILRVQEHAAINSAISNNFDYICNEILAVSLEIVPHINSTDSVLVEVNEDIKTLISINKF